LVPPQVRWQSPSRGWGSNRLPQIQQHRKPRSVIGDSPERLHSIEASTENSGSAGREEKQKEEAVRRITDIYIFFQNEERTGRKNDTGQMNIGRLIAKEVRIFGLVVQWRFGLKILF